MNNQFFKNRLPSLAVGILTTLWIMAVLAGWHGALGLGDRAAFIILLAAGITLCATGMEIQRFGWTNPFNLLGSIIGFVILFLVAAVFINLPLPGLNSDHSAFIDLAALMTLKVAIDLLRGLFTQRKPSTVG